MKKAAATAESSQELGATAENLVNTYLIPGSNTEVNVSDELRRSIKDIVEGKTSKTKKEMIAAFVEAQEETIKIMALGAFPRFLMSDTFNEYRAHEAEMAKSLHDAQRKGGKGKSFKNK